MTIYDAKSTRCPNCKNLIDSLTPCSEDAQPEAGDYTICLYCLSVLQLTEDLGVVACADWPSNVEHERRKMFYEIMIKSFKTKAMFN